MFLITGTAGIDLIYDDSEASYKVNPCCTSYEECETHGDYETHEYHTVTNIITLQ